jgi:pyruvate dehydrogenase E2 component (dihydrolipoamide acetyltransferase)
MPTNVHMEALSPTMEEGQLVKWLKKEGDAVSEGDVLAEIETDKATMELVARGSGVLRNVRLEEGGTAPVGEVIATIAAEGEDVAAADADGGKAKKAAPADKGSARKAAAEPAPDEDEDEPEATEAAKEADEEDADADEEAVGQGQEVEQGEEGEEAAEEREVAPAAAKGAQVDASQAAPRAGARPAADAGAAEGGRGEAAGTGAGDRPDGRVKASPLARKLASEVGLELTEVRGTGPGGRITKADIEAAMKRPPERAPAAAGAARPAAAPAAAGEDVTEVPVSQMRKAIAKRLVTSIGPIPTFYLTIDVDVTRLSEARARVNAILEKDGVKASVNDFLIKAVAMALARHPEVNASWGDTVILRHNRVHVGVAVAIEDGLITPIIRDADRKGIADIAREVRELAGRAREKKLKPDEYTGATFSVSNLGMFGIHEFTAIINPPESAILAVGAAEDAVVVVDGQPAVRQRMRMTMSCDHRVIDGAMGARFLQTLRGMIEEPMMMLA